MNCNARNQGVPRLRAVRFIVLCFVVLSCFRAFGTDQYTMKNVAPKEHYELRYLGCKLRKEGHYQWHEGIFLLIWKSDKATKILAYSNPDQKSFRLQPVFALHHDSGWKWAGGMCGTGLEWMVLQPGQVETLTMAMTDVERSSLPEVVKGADRAQLLVDTEEGQLSSDDIVLPLIPAKGK